jgi:hypothetical protein
MMVYLSANVAQLASYLAPDRVLGAWIMKQPGERDNDKKDPAA